MLIPIFFIFNNVFADSLFDCSNTTSSLENIICTDQNLADLNAISNELFLKSKQLDLQNSSNVNRSLYFNLRQCNDQQECLVSAYQDAITAYKDLITKNTPVVIEEKVAPEQSQTVENTQINLDQNNNSKTGFYSRTIEQFSTWIDSISFGGWLLIILLILAFIYFLPTIIAFSRGHRNRWVIFIINVVFGCTFLGWIIALIWAMNKIDDPVKGGVKHDSQPHDPVV